MGLSLMGAMFPVSCNAHADGPFVVLFEQDAPTRRLMRSRWGKMDDSVRA